MALPRLKPENSVLLVVDVQERLMPTIAAAERTAAHCALLARAAGVLGIPVICTEQYVKGLGHTVAALAERLPDGTPIIEKISVSPAASMNSSSDRASSVRVAS